LASDQTKSRTWISEGGKRSKPVSQSAGRGAGESSIGYWLDGQKGKRKGGPRRSSRGTAKEEVEKILSTDGLRNFDHRVWGTYPPREFFQKLDSIDFLIARRRLRAVLEDYTGQ